VHAREYVCLCVCIIKYKHSQPAFNSPLAAAAAHCLNGLFRSPTYTHSYQQTPSQHSSPAHVCVRAHVRGKIERRDVCVCVCLRERERETVCERERERERPTCRYTYMFA
jgi:hypothetical protein